MDDLARRIRSAIENPNNDPWWPGLTDELAATEWDRLHREIGLSPDTYGTNRLLGRNISARRDIISSLTAPPSSVVPTMALEALSSEWVRHYKKVGISFYTPQEILNSCVLTCLEEAILIVNQVPSLMRTVASLVRSVHVIKPEDEYHDVSFSEPNVPFSIFVSVPEKRIANNALRVAEAIVHEAMHLQLTIIEHVVPVTVSLSKKYYSPWRRELRDARGIIHALYVFAVIHRFLAQISSSMSQRLLTEHVRRRQVEINMQINNIESFQTSSELTFLGAQLVQSLIYSSRVSLRCSRVFRTLPNSSSTSLTEFLSPDS